MSAAIFLAAGFLAGGGIGAVVGRIGGNRELRQENEELRHRHEAWNRAAQRTDLDEIGRVTPPRGQRIVSADTRIGDDLDPEPWLAARNDVQTP